ncbi:hypothetical protein SAMN02799630_01507 [Paenibacillus sp. UNCCL117]|uniref:hypothetical protein n=1 Tax=unclassified Paenibacillus TaxID=185978 RepID=UPI000887A3D6|nr:MULTISPECIES: hypothetical protein [unclassified Paenibacillus]SDC79424.1 hypothetical protein SAMN04488602_103486 [Paenibacillus sp. cl123]SFW26293.1 hypothetical protein SAMN02799630_01507 [Paenibacillus sp. UNCCL117]
MFTNQFQNNFQNQASGANSQYRGIDSRYQPVGYVQSQYNQSLNPSMNNTFASAISQQPQSYQQFQSPQAYHTANYRGDQQGHDSYLRSDSTQPAQSQFGMGASSFQSNNVFAASGIQNQAVTANQSYNTPYQTTQSFHTANYRGSQPGHDAYLRSDSTQPAQSQYGIGAASFSSSAPFVSSVNSNFGQQQSFSNNAFAQSQNQFQSPQSYHTANYRGNQPGHDSYLRSDSSQTAQSQYGAGSMSAGYINKFQF